MPDPFTHMLSAFVLSRVPKIDHTRLLLIAVVLPDIDVAADVVSALVSGRGFEFIYHPSFTHSVFFIPLVAAVALLVYKIAFKPRNVGWHIFAIASLGVALHLGLDLLTEGGNLLWPIRGNFGLNLWPTTIGAYAVFTLASMLVLIACWLVLSKNVRRNLRWARPRAARSSARA